MGDIRFLTDHYDEKIQRINQIDAPLNFVFITDLHNRLNYATNLRTPGHENDSCELAVEHVASIQYILDRCPGISFVVCGGDIGNDYDHDPAAIRQSHQEIMDALYALSVPVHCCIGNHDDALGVAIERGVNNVPFAILPDELHRLCMKNNPTEENYYYIDLDEQKYRILFLNTSDRPYFIDESGQYPYPWRYEISDKQVAWLENEALKTDYRILVISHIPFINDGIFGSAGAPNFILPYDDLHNGPRVHHILKNCPNVVSTIHGHVHYDNLIYRDGMATVTTQCSFGWGWAPSCPVRTFGTITETAFDVFSIKNNVMHITRFGAGFDRTVGFLR